MRKQKKAENTSSIPELKMIYHDRKYILPLTAGVVILILALAFMFWFEFKILLLTVSISLGSFALIRVGRLLLRVGFEAVDRALEMLIKWEELKGVRAKNERDRFIDTGAGGGFIPNDLADKYKRYDRQLPARVGDMEFVIEGQTGGRDLFEVLSGTKQGYSFVAPQQQGKTTAMDRYTQWLREHRPEDKTLVIGVKALAHEWRSVDGRFIGSPDKIEQALKVILDQMKQRHETSVKTPIIRLILDDWTATKDECPDITPLFLSRMLTVMVSAGIIPYVMLQGNSVEEWGLKGLGSAQLKDNFTLIEFSGPRDAKGDPIVEKTEATVTYRGMKPLPVTLPWSSDSPIVIPKKSGPHPTQKQSQVLRLWDMGERDTNKIAKAVYGGGGNQVNLVTNTLSKFERKK